jgi:hypothetical protein
VEHPSPAPQIISSVGIDHGIADDLASGVAQHQAGAVVV